MSEGGWLHGVDLRKWQQRGFTPAASAEAIQDALNRWLASSGPDETPPTGEADIVAALQRAKLDVPAGVVRLEDLAAQITAAGGPAVRVDPSLGDQRLVLTPGAWSVVDLLRATTAACRASCWRDGDGIEIGPLRTVMHPVILRQMDLAGDWRTRAFAGTQLLAADNQRLADLTADQRDFLVKAVGSGPRAVVAGADAHVIVFPNVTVRLELWAPLSADLSESGADRGPDAFELVQELRVDVPSWSWRRLDFGRPGPADAGHA